MKAPNQIKSVVIGPFVSTSFTFTQTFSLSLHRLELTVSRQGSARPLLDLWWMQGRLFAPPGVRKDDLTTGLSMMLEKEEVEGKKAGRAF